MSEIPLLGNQEEDDPLLSLDPQDQSTEATIAPPAPTDEPQPLSSVQHSVQQQIPHDQSQLSQNEPLPPPNTDSAPRMQVPVRAPQTSAVVQPIPQYAVQSLGPSAQPVYPAVPQRPQSTSHPYQPGPMMVMPPRPPILPRERQPNDYLVITLVVAIACGLLNITSLMFSIAAIICSTVAFERRSYGKYSEAKRLGIAAIILDMISVAWVMIWGVIITGLVLACVYHVGICVHEYY